MDDAALAVVLGLFLRQVRQAAQGCSALLRSALLRAAAVGPAVVWQAWLVELGPDFATHTHEIRLR